MISNEKSKSTIMGKINSALTNMSDLPKKMIKYATPVALFLMALGTALFVANKISNNYSSFFENITTTLITNSFFVLAEFIIASLVMDMLIKKKSQ
jgi:hypothetical protein